MKKKLKNKNEKENKITIDVISAMPIFCEFCVDIFHFVPQDFFHSAPPFMCVCFVSYLFSMFVDLTSSHIQYTPFFHCFQLNFMLKFFNLFQPCVFPHIFRHSFDVWALLLLVLLLLIFFRCAHHHIALIKLILFLYFIFPFIDLFPCENIVIIKMNQCAFKCFVSSCVCFHFLRWISSFHLLF